MALFRPGTVTGTSSFAGSASYAENAGTASFVTASNVWGPFGSSSIESASYASSSTSASYALTASYALNAGSPGGLNTQIQFNSGSEFSGSANFTFDYLNNITYLTGSSWVSGSMTLTGSMYVSGAISASFGPNTVGFYGTASWAVSASRATSASYADIAGGLVAGAPVPAHPPEYSIQFNSGSYLSGSEHLLYRYYSHSLEQGRKVMTSGSSWAHAQGLLTWASGAYSHAEGMGSGSYAGGTYSGDVRGFVVNTTNAKLIYGTLPDPSYLIGATITFWSGAGKTGTVQTTTVLTAVDSGGLVLITVADQAIDSFLKANGATWQATTSPILTGGLHNIAYDSGSHTEGYYGAAAGWASHNEGYQTTAFGSSSHAEGYRTIAGAWGFEGKGNVFLNNTQSFQLAGIDLTYYLSVGDRIWLYNASTSQYRLVTIATIANNTGLGGFYTHLTDISVYPVPFYISTGVLFPLWWGDGANPFGTATPSQIPPIWVQNNGSNAGVNGFRLLNIAGQGQARFGTGKYAHAEGEKTIAYGDSSHAEGYRTLALAAGAHTEGTLTEVHASFGHAEGDRSRVLPGGLYAHAEGQDTEALGIGSHTEGVSTHANGSYSHAEGFVHKDAYFDELGNYIQIIISPSASGYGSHVEGTATKTLGFASHAEGFYTTASGDYSHAEGAGQLYAKSGILFNIPLSATGKASHAEGQSTTAEGDYSHAEGLTTYTEGDGAHAEGTFTTASGDYSHAEGYSTWAITDGAHTEGSFTTASGFFSHAEGSSSLASGIAAHAEGLATSASGYFSHAEGNTSYAKGLGSHAEGFYTSASGEYSHAEGAYTTTEYSEPAGGGGGGGGGLGGGGLGIGGGGGGLVRKVSGSYAHAEGIYTTASGDFSHAEGSGSWAGEQAAHAEGLYTSAVNKGDHSEGEKTYAKGYASHAEGLYTSASQYGAHAEGSSSLASGIAAHAEGFLTTASGYFSHAEGVSTWASGLGAHTEGRHTTASAEGSHAEGISTLASDNYSHAEGQYTTASATYSHAEGVSTWASGLGAHTQGAFTTASGQYSHAEGRGTVASAEGAHSEGYFATASGNYSHAQGDSTWAAGEGSHTQGQQTTASGDYSHAEGQKSYAVGLWSHAGGLHTIAYKDHSTTVGQYNIDLNNDDIFVIGDGADDGNRHDLLNAGIGVIRITGSAIVSSSLNVIGISNVTGSNNITGSWDLKGDGHVTGSFDITGSYGLIGEGAVTGSFMITGSLVADYASLTGSLTGSFLGTGSGFFDGLFTGSNPNGVSFYGTSSWAESASFVTGSIFTGTNVAATASLALNNITTASVSANVITFTKGDGSTFPITVDTGSADITEVIAGTGLDGGGTSGAVTLDVNYTDVSASMAGFGFSYGDITEVIAGTGLDGGGTSGAVTLDINYTDVSASMAGFGFSYGDITGVTAGTGLTGGGTSGDVTLNVDYSAVSASMAGYGFGSGGGGGGGGGDITDVNAGNGILVDNPTGPAPTVNLNTGSAHFIAGVSNLTGSLLTTTSFNSWTGSNSSQFAGTASYATNAATASFVTGSNVYGPFGSNSVLTASYASSSTSASYALTASYALNALGGDFVPNSWTGSNSSQFAGTASYATNAGTASAIDVVLSSNTNERLPIILAYTSSNSGTKLAYIDAGFDYNTSTNALYLPSNGALVIGNTTIQTSTATFGSAGNQNHVVLITGSLNVSKSVNVDGTVTAGFGANTVGFIGTASWAVSTSNAVTASYITASNVFGPFGSNSILSASYASSSLSASYALSASFAVSSSRAATASLALSLSPSFVIPPGGQNTQIQFHYVDPVGGVSKLSGSALFKYLYDRDSLSQGVQVEALSSYSHAQGRDTVTRMDFSHAEGLDTQTGLGYVQMAKPVFGGTDTVAGIPSPQASMRDEINNSAFIIFYQKDYPHYFQIFYSQSYIASGGDVTFINVDISNNFGTDDILFVSNPQGTNLRGLSKINGFMGSGSHTEGSGSTTAGLGSHAEGYWTTALNDYSHAEGESTIAGGVASHTEGYFTISSGSYQTVVGQYNEIKASQSAFIVGDGIDSGSRHNILFVSKSYFEVNASKDTQDRGPMIRASFEQTTSEGPVIKLGDVNTNNNSTSFEINDDTQITTIQSTTINLNGAVYAPNLTDTGQTNIVVWDSISGQFGYTASSAIGGGGGPTTPGGPLRSIQFNSASVFSGSSNFTFNEITNQLDLTGSMSISGSARITSSLYLPGLTTSPFNNVLIIDTGSGQVYFTASSAIGGGGGGGIGGGGGTNATQSFSTPTTTWTFTHNLNNRYVIVQTLDTSFNQIIPQNIELTNANTATITFPTNVAGYAIASLGGLGVSASYAATASIATSASFATTSSYVTRYEGAWASYTPSWTSTGTQPSIGNGSITAAYKQIGKTVFVRLKLQWGSTTGGGTGIWSFGLPVTASVADTVQLPCSVYDNSANNWFISTANGGYSSLDYATSIVALKAGGSNVIQALDSTFPMNWATSDTLQFNGSYEAL